MESPDQKVEGQEMQAADAVLPEVMAAEVDKVIELGQVGKIEIDFNKGVAKVSISAAVPGQVGLEGGAFIQCDAEQLVSAIAEAIKKKLPDAADPIADTVKVILIQALKAIQ